MRWISIVLMVFLIAYGGTAYCESCAVTTTSASFGGYDMLASAPVDTAAEISITCDPGIAYNVILDTGQNSIQDFHPRRMRSLTGDSTLDYNFYRDAARTEIWGDGVGNTFTFTGVGNGGTEILRAYGRIPALQNVRADSYSDSIAVIVEW